MSPAQNINLDTSVLFNYVFSSLPGDIEPDKGSQRLIDSDSYYCVIGGKAKGEFDSGCKRRHDIYDDLVTWLENNPSTSIYDYDVTQRNVQVSSNDIDHVRMDIQHGWADEERRKQLSDIRACSQDIDNYRELMLLHLIDQIYEKAQNRPLLSELTGLGLDHDKDIIVDAVEINSQDGIDILVATDGDITEPDQRDAINDAIEHVEGSGLVLSIVRPPDL